MREWLGVGTTRHIPIEDITNDEGSEPNLNQNIPPPESDEELDQEAAERLTNEEFEERQKRRNERAENEMFAFSENQIQEMKLLYSAVDPGWQVPNLGKVLKRLKHEAKKEIRVIDSDAQRRVRARVVATSPIFVFTFFSNRNGRLAHRLTVFIIFSNSAT